MDDEDYELVSRYRWSPTQGQRQRETFYAQTWISGTGNRKMHRLILPDMKIIDHVNGDGLDNRRSNLRIASRRDNNRNVPLRSDNTSGFKGACWDRRANKWLASISVNGKNLFLGRYADKMDAALAYDRAAVEHFGEFARLNFPEGRGR